MKPKRTTETICLEPLKPERLVFKDGDAPLSGDQAGFAIVFLSKPIDLGDGDTYVSYLNMPDRRYYVHEEYEFIQERIQSAFDAGVCAGRRYLGNDGELNDDAAPDDERMMFRVSPDGTIQPVDDPVGELKDDKNVWTLLEVERWMSKRNILRRAWRARFGDDFSSTGGDK